MLSLIIIHYATPESLAQTLAAFARPEGLESFEIVVVDNASLGPVAPILQDYFPKVRFILNRSNVGFGRAANQGASIARGESLLFLNGDCFLGPEQLQAIGEAAGTLERAGAVGFRQVTPTGRPQLTFGRFPTFRSELKRRRWQKALDVEGAEWAIREFDRLGQRPFEVDWVSGSCLWTPREVFEQVGGFDETFFLYFEDIDLCRRIQQQGWKIYHCPQPEILHLHGAGAAQNPPLARAAYRQSQRYFAKKHRGAWGALTMKAYQQARTLLGLP